jgi:hypothetical protein
MAQAYRKNPRAPDEIARYLIRLTREDFVMAYIQERARLLGIARKGPIA